MIEKKNACTGCTACMNICPKGAISMKSDFGGFLYPEVDPQLCINCGMCDRSCPLNRERRPSENMPFVYAVKNKDNNVRKKCASGGIFSALSDWVLESGGVVYGAAFDSSFAVRHIRADHKSSRDRMLGSKYPQSILGDTFQWVKEDLDLGTNVLFTGTPCQIAGLEQYLRKDYNNLFLCDIICHGVMSPRLFEDFLNLLKEEFHSPVSQICFRDKEDDWINQRWRYETENGKYRVDDNWILKLKKVYYDGLCLRPACYECRYANMQRAGDLTIGDYWGIDAAVPGFRDAHGVSCVLINTSRGQNLFDKVSDRLEIVATDVESCMQPQLSNPSEKNPRTEEFWQYYQKHSLKEVLKEYARLSVKDEIKSRIPIDIRKRTK